MITPASHWLVVGYTCLSPLQHMRFNDTSLCATPARSMYHFLPTPHTCSLPPEAPRSAELPGILELHGCTRSTSPKTLLRQVCGAPRAFRLHVSEARLVEVLVVQMQARGSFDTPGQTDNVAFLVRTAYTPHFAADVQVTTKDSQVADVI